MSREITDSPAEWQHLLDPDETILWQGRPNGGLRFKGKNLALSAFGVAFLGFSLFWTISAVSMTTETPGPVGWVFPLFGLPFIVVGLWLVVGVHFFDAFKRRNSFYTLTNRRAFIGTDMFRRSLNSYPIHADTILEFRPGPPDTIILALIDRQEDDSSHVEEVGFEYIDNGHEVYELIRKVQRGEA